MTDHALASFEAKDGTGRWEVFTWGIIANGQRYHFTKQSHIVCAGLPGRTEKHVYQTEEDDGFGLWAALAVYQETGSLADAGLAAWALGGPSIETHIDTREIPGNVTLLYRALAPRPRCQPLPALPRGRPLGSSRCHPTLRRHHPRRHQCLPRECAVTVLTPKAPEALQKCETKNRKSVRISDLKMPKNVSECPSCTLTTP